MLDLRSKKKKLEALGGRGPLPFAAQALGGVSDLGAGTPKSSSSLSWEVLGLGTQPGVPGTPLSNQRVHRFKTHTHRGILGVSKLQNAFSPAFVGWFHSRKVSVFGALEGSVRDVCWSHVSTSSRIPELWILFLVSFQTAKSGCPKHGEST